MNRFDPRAWPTHAEIKEVFSGLRTQWLVPYRDHRGPLPRQHTRPLMPPPPVVHAIAATPRRREPPADFAAYRDAARYVLVATWWVRFLVAWVTDLWCRQATEEPTPQVLMSRLKQLSALLVRIDFRHPPLTR